MSTDPPDPITIWRFLYLIGRLQLDGGTVINFVLSLEQLDSSGARFPSRLSRSLSRFHHQFVLHAVQVQASVGGNVAVVHLLLSVL